MEQTNKLISFLKKSKNVILLAHVSPDGDTLGSMLGLRGILSQLKNLERIDVAVVGKIPDIYRFLPDIDLVRNPDNDNLYKSYDMAISLDCASIDRLGEAIDLFRNAKITVNIDHHISNTNFADINIVDSLTSACGEVIFSLAQLFPAKITEKIATCLYTAILTDTGGFKFESTLESTFLTCAALIKAGAKPYRIYKECYESKPYEMVMLHAYAISNSITAENGKIIFTSISRDLLKKLKASDDYIDGIAETLRQINTVEVAIVFKETPKGNTKLSFRSNRVNVCDISKYFGGGGHKLAAGCTIEKNIADSISEVIPIVKKQILK